MISTIRLFLAPLAAILFTLWAAWIALAAEADADPTRTERGRGAPNALPLSLSRSLHIAHLALLVLAGFAAAGAVAWWLWPPIPGAIRLVVAIGVVWIVADLLPRLLAELAPELAAPARRGAARTLLPFGPLLRFIARADRRFRAAGVAEPRRPLGDVQRDMLLGVFALADTTVSEVMTPRIDIVAVDTGATQEEVIATLRRSEHARILVYDDHPDAVTGVIYAKDMLAALHGETGAGDWHAMIRPAAFVPEGKTLDRQLRDFQRGPGHLAVVVDEYGGTAGLLTLEDILEQVVGEIRDEYDTDEVAPVQPLSDESWRVDGGVSLAELELLVGHEFGREDVSTVGGLVLAELGRVPRSGEVLELGPVRMQVEQVVRRRVKRVLVQREAASTRSAEATA